MEDIGDPLGDRVMKNVPQIARFPLTAEELWHHSGKHNFSKPVITPTSATEPIAHLLRSCSNGHEITILIQIHFQILVFKHDLNTIVICM